MDGNLFRIRKSSGRTRDDVRMPVADEATTTLPVAIDHLCVRREEHPKLRFAPVVTSEDQQWFCDRCSVGSYFGISPSNEAR